MINMPKSMFFRIVAIAVLIILYCILFYLQYHHKILIDFSSFYFAAQYLSKGMNPYQTITTNFFPSQNLLPSNLNPPCVLWLVQLIVPLGFYKALILWNALSIGASMKTASLTFKVLKQNPYFTMKQIDFWILYFCAFPIFMNAIICQLGAVLAFFIMQGYVYSQEGKTWRAGFLWGAIAAFKLFPLLLLVYAFLNQQKKLALIMLASFIVLFLSPIFVYGPELFNNFYSFLHKALWYGDNWNASLYGFLFRIFADPMHATLSDLFYIKSAYALFFIIGFVLYAIKTYKFSNENNELRAFNLCLVLMLLLSPLGWLYYFSILFLPAFTVWTEIQAGYNRIGIFYFLLTYTALVFLCVPINYIEARHLPHDITLITVFSVHFYGLMLLVISMFIPPTCSHPSYSKNDLLILNRTLILILGWGVLILAYYILRTFMYAW